MKTFITFEIAIDMYWYTWNIL